MAEWFVLKILALKLFWHFYADKNKILILKNDKIKIDCIHKPAA